MTERIQKLISAAGLMSRRAAEEAISAGRVCVNGEKAQLGDKADPALDRITVDGKELPREGEKLYLMLHKPRGYVTTLRDEKGRKNVTELMTGLETRVYPVGRLDMYSEGLLFSTWMPKQWPPASMPSIDAECRTSAKRMSCKDVAPAGVVAASSGSNEKSWPGCAPGTSTASSTRA